MVAQLNILVVEDHDALRDVMVETLAKQGHHVTGIESAEAIGDMCSGLDFDIAILDLQLPGEDGLSLARRLRQMQPNVGILMVTARGQTADKCVGYESGADIYLTKPVQPAELGAAIQALGRRVRNLQPLTALQLNMQRLLLINAAGQETALSSQEARLLAAFVRAPGQRLESWQLMELLGKTQSDYSKSALELHIVRLRKKLGQTEVAAGAPSIRAIRNWGYQLCLPLALV